MKEGWEIKKIKDICDKGSSNVAQKDLEKHDGEYPIFGASGLIKGVDFYHQDKEYVGIVKDGSGIGRVAFYPPKSSLIGTLQYIIPKEGYDIRYIGYCLQSLNLSSYRQGAAIPHIYFRDYGEKEVHVAKDLTEQQRIVSLLDEEFEKIDRLKSNAELNLQHAKDLFQAALKKELEPKKGWIRKSIPEISDNLDSKRIPVTKRDRVDGKYPYYGASGIVDYVNNYIFDDDLLLVSEDGANLVARVYPIAFSVSGKLWVNNHAHVLKFNSIPLQHFVEYFFASADLSNYISGMAQPKFNQKALNSIVVSFPQKDAELNEIVNTLDDLNAKCKVLQSNYTKTIQLCDDLKQSLLSKAFVGEL